MSWEAYNICCLIHALFELVIESKFCETEEEKSVLIPRPSMPVNLRPTILSRGAR